MATELRADRDWTLNARAFDRLLSKLDPDRERAALAYERLRLRLIKLIRWWGASTPEELADATLDRVARKLEKGTAVSGGSFGAFVRGVARMIVHESNRRCRLAAKLAAPTLVCGPNNTTAALDCLERCLETLAPSDRQLVLEYYGEGKAAETRRRLAVELGVTPTALRIRAHRVRQRLERCVNSAMAARAPTL